MDNEGCSGEHNHGGPQESSIEERTNVNKGEGVLKKNSKENLQARSKEVDDSQKGELGKQPPDDGFSFPFELKWPLTRAERIRELQQMASHYQGTGQEINISAAITWHSEFPPDEVVPEGEFMFQKGRKIQESDFRWENGAPWWEGCIDQFVDQQGPPQPGTGLSAASHPTQYVQYTYYHRDNAPRSHMYQV